MTFIEMTGSDAIVEALVLASRDTLCCNEKRPFDMFNHQQLQFFVLAILIRLLVNEATETGLLGMALTGLQNVMASIIFSLY